MEGTVQVRWNIHRKGNSGGRSLDRTWGRRGWPNRKKDKGNRRTFIGRAGEYPQGKKWKSLLEERGEGRRGGNGGGGG